MGTGARTIKIDSGAEFKIKIENITDFEESFFREAYVKAIKNVEEIKDNNEKYYEIKNKPGNDIFDYKDREEKNNIIAFIGERGAGKTSAMISFAKALKEIKKYHSLENRMREKFATISDCNFWVLDVIDPSLFEKEESVFQVIIAKLFNEFKKILEKDDEDTRSDEQRKIIRMFKKVYDNFNLVVSGGKPSSTVDLGESLEALSNLAAGSNMRNSFIELIVQLLRYKFGDSSKEKQYLVLSIDDIDMNIGKAAEMAEQIRKYLLIPNIIVLMAVKVEQLTDSIQQKFIEEYEVFLKYDGELEEDTNVMAARYIEKLIPNGKKIYLPSLKYVEDIEHVTLEIGNKVDIGVQETVLKTILEKTGLIFLKPEHGMHMFIPDNLRELQNFMAILNKLLDVSLQGWDVKEAKEKNQTILKQNVDVFESYFNNIWIKRNLCTQDAKLLEEFKRLPIEQKNKFIIGILYEKNLLLRKESEIVSKIDTKISSLVSNFNKKAFNVSLGDVLDGLAVSDEYDTEASRKFKFSIQVVYSIELLKSIYLIKEQERTYRLLAGNVLGEISNKVIRNSKEGDLRTEFEFERYNKMPIVFEVKAKIKRHGEFTGEDKVIIFKMSLKNAIRLLTSTANISNWTWYNCPKSYDIEKDGPWIERKDKGQSDDAYVIAQAYSNKEKREYSDIVNIGDFYNACIQSIIRIHYFVFPRYQAELSQLAEREYDIEAAIGTGGNEMITARFSILGFIARLVYPQRLMEVVLNKKLSNDGKEKIVYKQIVNDKETEEIKEFLPTIIEDKLEKWVDKYKVILPIYSIELLMALRNKFENDRRYSSGPKEAKNTDYDYIKDLFKVLKNNVLFELEERIIGEVCIQEAFEECPIVKLFTQQSEDSEIIQKQIEFIFENRKLLESKKDKERRESTVMKLVSAYKDIKELKIDSAISTGNRKMRGLIDAVETTDKNIIAISQYRILKFDGETQVTQDIKDKFIDAANSILKELISKKGEELKIQWDEEGGIRWTSSEQ